MELEYLVVKPSIVGGPESHFEEIYESDTQRFPTRAGAMSHGFELYGHDDWLIATVRGDQIVNVGWMKNDRKDMNEMANVAYYLGMTIVEGVEP